MAEQQPLIVTIRDLLTNPPGRKTRQVGPRYAIKASLDAAYIALVKDPEKARKFEVSVSGSGPYVVWVKVPSATLDMQFDVVIELDPGESRAVSAMRARLYCNSPGWVFTQGYVARKEGVLAPGWDKALGRAAKERPRVTNPTETLSFDKVVHFALLWILGRGGILTLKDLEAATGKKAPDPQDETLWAESKLEVYTKLKAHQAAIHRNIRAVERKAKVAQKEEERKHRKSTALGQRTGRAVKTTKTAKVAGTVKAAGKKRG